MLGFSVIAMWLHVFLFSETGSLIGLVVKVAVCDKPTRNPL